MASAPVIVGLIDLECDPARVAAQAAENAQYLCMQTYAESPPYKIQTVTKNPTNTIKFPYIPANLYHVMFELLKNAMRAVIEQNHDKAAPVKIIIVEGEEDLTIKISDEGGGIPRSGMPQIFTYMYTTGENRIWLISPPPFSNAFPLFLSINSQDAHA